MKKNPQKNRATAVRQSGQTHLYHLVNQSSYTPLTSKTAVVWTQWGFGYWLVWSTPPCTVPAHHLTQPCRQALAQPEAEWASGIGSAAPHAVNTNHICTHLALFWERAKLGQREGCKSNILSCARCRITCHPRFAARKGERRENGSPGDLFFPAHHRHSST